MGCGASDIRGPPGDMEKRQQRTLPLRDVDAVQAAIDAPLPAGVTRVCIGVFGLRSAGKSAMMHSIRNHMMAASSAAAAAASSAALPLPPAAVAAAVVPLPAPTQRLELFTGPVPAAASSSPAASLDVVCVDTPGLPCGASQRSRLLSLLPRLQRLVWVVDATPEAEWQLEASKREMMALWREVTQHNEATGGAGAGPALHIVCSKQSVAGALTPDAVAAAQHLSRHFSPSSLPAMLHGWSCEWDAARKDAAIRSLLGAAAIADSTHSDEGQWATRTQATTTTTPSAAPSASATAREGGAAASARDAAASPLTTTHVLLAGS